MLLLLIDPNGYQVAARSVEASSRGQTAAELAELARAEAATWRDIMSGHAARLGGPATANGRTMHERALQFRAESYRIVPQG
ncbi:hypothetical protein [Kitasatospora sp. NPDC088783]|uniref:hypothetical protein n=1 Tax=Kitasatospora sp. NPDC088783 TaxID=3364077 RepID=UPI0037FC33E5